MPSKNLVQVILLVVLIFLSAFFSSAETALTTVNKIRIRYLAERGNKAALIILKIIDEPEKMLSAILIGNNIVNLYASSLATTITIRVFGSSFIGLITGVLTFIVLIFGEITPKTMATKNAEEMALFFSGIIYILMILLTPIIYIVNKAAKIVLRLLGTDMDKKTDIMTEEDLRTIVEVGHEDGIIEKEEKKIINNVFDFGNTVARDIMIPRIDMSFIDAEADYDELLEVFRRDRYTRIPVFKDSSDNVIGIINVKDLLLIDRGKEFNIRDYLREPLYTYEYKKTAELMLEMRKTFNSFAIVLDEYGVTAGMITLEDMLEEIVGEIRDEYDDDEEESIISLGKGEYLIDAAMNLDDINEALGLNLVSEDYDSIGGLVMGMLDHLPKAKEEVEYEGIRMIVEKMEKARMSKIKLCL